MSAINESAARLNKALLMRFLFILNGPPYGDERCYSALRLALAIHKAAPDAEIVLFLMADAVGGGRILLCGTCMDARGLAEDMAIEGARRSTMDELAQETLSADKVLVF